MNMAVLALMVGITVTVVGLILFAVQGDHPVILAAILGAVAVAFAPWHRWR